MSIAIDLVRYHTGLDFADWWKTQRSGEIHPDLVCFWRKLDPFLGFSGSGTNLKLDIEGTGDMRLYAFVDGEPDPQNAAPAFPFFWDMGAPPFDPGGTWIWTLDPRFGLFHWSKIEAVSQDALSLGSWQARDYRCIR